MGTRSKGDDSQPSRQPRRRSGRHPHATQVDVRLTEPAVRDLELLKTSNRNALRWALKKLLLLERNPEAGRPLHGDLQGWRKLTVGNRDWRIIWRVTFDDEGPIIVDVAEVWAIGARSDGEIYEEMISRLRALEPSPRTEALWEIATRLEPADHEQVDETPERVPEWLIQDLTKGAGLSFDLVSRMTYEDALAALVEWRSRPSTRR
jgi:mRNA interferase RelE/StbE